MLTKNAVAAATAVTTALETSGVYADAKSGTPLRLMVDQCMCEVALGPDLSLELIVAGLEVASAKKTPTDQYPHDVATAQVVELASKALQNNIAYARHVVNPLIEQVVEGIKTREANRDARFAYGFDVVPFEYADFWDNSGFVATVEKYREMVAEPWVFSGGLGQMTKDELRALIKGSSSVEKAVLEYVEKMSSEEDDYLVRLYNDVFFNNEATALTASFMAPGSTVGSASFTPNQVGCNHVAVLHFLAKGLLKSIPDGFSGDAKKFEASMGVLVGQTGRRLAGALEARRRDYASGRLVLSQSEKLLDRGKTKTTILVNADVYTQFLKEGGSVEAIIGNALTDKALLKDEIAKGMERYLAAQQVYARNMIERDNTEYHARTIASLRAELYQTLNERLKEGQSTRTRGDAVKEIEEHLKYVTLADLDNLWVVARKLVCHCFFYGTNVLSILTYMDDLAKRMPSADGRLLSYYASVEVLADWVCEYLTVIKP
jgi:hypothetical protein